jgi:hypothetical protein
VDLDLFGSATFSQVALKLFPRRMVYESGTGQVHTGFGDVTELEVTVDLLRFQGQSPALTVVVQHSDDGSSWTDMLTFAGVGEDEETDTFTGDVKDQVRVAWTLTGTNAAANFSVSARVLDADAPASGDAGLPPQWVTDEDGALTLEYSWNSASPAIKVRYAEEPGTFVSFSPEGVELRGDSDNGVTAMNQSEFRAVDDDLVVRFAAGRNNVVVKNSDDEVVFEINSSGQVVMPNLPTVSPGAGRLWNDSGTIKIG